MKRCVKCKLSKDDEAFSFRNKVNKKRNNTCKECHRKYVKRHYLKHKDVYVKRAMLHTEQQRRVNQKNLFGFLQGKACWMCGNSDIRVLDFDHQDRNKKHRDISDMVLSGYAWKTILLEIEKCKITCANCHRIKTSEELGWYKSQLNCVVE